MAEQVQAHLRRVHALLAGATAGEGALVDDIDELYRFERILGAWDDEMRPMERGEIAAACNMEGDPAFDRRFHLLTHYGAIIQHRRKASTSKWTPNPVALISAELLTSLADESAADRLADLIILALDRLDDPDITLAELLGTAGQLTRVVNVVAAAIHRAVDVGTLADLIEVRPSARAQRQVARVSQIVELAHTRFGEHVARLRELIEAADNFAQATDRLGQRLMEQAEATGASGLFSLLDPSAVDAAARRAPPAKLARLGRDIVFDAPAVRFTRQGLYDAADEIGRPPVPRPDPPVPDATTQVDATAELDRVRQSARRREQARRRWATALLAEDDQTVVAEDVWPAPVQRLVDGLRLAADRGVPVTCDLSQQVRVDADANVAINTPLRLRRLDRHEPDVLADRTEDRQEEHP